MYLLAVINIGNFEYIPCKQYIKNHNKFVKKFIQKANPGLYTLNFSNTNYVCLKTNNKIYIFDSLNQKFSEEIEPIELISDLLFTIYNSNSKKRLLSMLIIILCKSFKWNNDDIIKLLSYAEDLENNKEIKETIITDIYINNQQLYNLIVGGSIKPSSKHSNNSSQNKNIPTSTNNHNSNNSSQNKNIPTSTNNHNSNISSQNKNIPTSTNNHNSNNQLLNIPDKQELQKYVNMLDINNIPNMQDMQKYANMLPKNIPHMQDMQKYASMLPKNIPHMQDMQKYANMLPKNIPNMKDMQKYANMLPKDIPKDTMLGVFLSILFSFIQGIPFIGYPLIIYETIRNIYNGEYSSLLIKPLKFIPGLGFIINLFTIFGKFGKFINLAFS